MAGGSYTANATATLYAVWRKANTYKITYNANSGSGAPSAQTKTETVTLKLSSTKPTRTGHTFLGWSKSSTATTATYSAGGSYTANAAATLYAVWKKNPYTISYSTNGGSGAPASQTKTYGVTLKLSSTKPTRTGHTFLGWSTSSTATTATYLAGGSYTANATATLYAVWKKTTYTITYNANGGGGVPASQTKTYGVNLTLSSTKPTRRGFTFLDWSTSSTATSATYSTGSSYTANAAATLYAVWKAQGGTWTPSSMPSTGSGIALKVYMPKDIAQEYYNVISSESNIELIWNWGKELGVGALVTKVAGYFGVSSGAAGAIVGVVILGVNIGKNISKNALLEKIRSCPSNGFVVIEYWFLINKLTGQMTYTIQHGNASAVDSSGSFLAGVYRT